jgi:soluble lytic murein transglycosylase
MRVIGTLLDLRDGSNLIGIAIRKRRIPTIGPVLLLALLLALPIGAADAQPLSRSAQASAKAALAAADRNRWTEAAGHAAKTGVPAFEKYVDWIRIGDEKSGARFEEIAAFLTANPAWPGLKRLRRRAEEAIGPSLPDDLILAWFAKAPPETPDGAFQYARVLEATGRIEEAGQVVRDAWINMEMGRTQGDDFRRRFHKYIRQDDDIARLDHLLWDREVNASRRQLRYLPKSYRAMTESRIAFMVRSRKAPGTLRSVSKDFLDDPGMVFEQMRYYRRIREPEKSVALLLAYPRLPKGPRPDRWWRERQYLVRWALSEEDPATAYKLVSTHVQTWGSEFAEAEFLAGWIALRKLNKPEDARRHFQALYDNVNYPVSRSRGAYWLARSYEALEQHNTATRWYRQAAMHPTRFYGQLAAGHLLEAERPSLPPEPAPGAAQIAAFEAGELPRLVRVLASLDEQRMLRRFIIAIAEIAKDPVDWTLAARLAQDIGRYDLAVSVSKLALRDGVILGDTGYPALEPANASAAKFPDPQILHAVVRQESAFDKQAISHAGARGLMQLMPQTALRVAQALKMRYSKARLTRDPSYNLRLGQAYLARMLDVYDGSLILAFASYNAGPHRVERWLQRYGDPGPFIYDAIDWAESIPFTETRNYVQRVIENLVVYRNRDGRKELALTYKTLEPGPVKDSAGRLEGAAPLPLPLKYEEDDEDDFAGP